MLKLINKIQQNMYIMQIMTLMSGSLIAQVIMLLSIPILTRLYTPSEFGLYSVFFSVVTIIGSISSLKYDQAIMLPKSTKDAQALVFLSVILTTSITLLSILILFIFYDFVVSYFNGSTFVIYLIPIGIFLIGMLQIFNAYTSRNQFYKTLSTVKVINAISVVTIQGFTRYIMKLDGLVIGKLIGDFITLLILLRYHLKKQTIQLSAISRRRIKVNAKRHEHFPKYQSITVFLNSISQSIPILLLGSLYTPEIVGYYALTIRVLRTPIMLIGASTREVYYQRASKLYANKENFFNLYYKTTLGLSKLFIIPFFVVLFFGDNLFSFVFGLNWLIAGEYSQILIFWYFFAFINSPSIMTFSILSLQSVQLKIEIISLVLRLLALYGGYYLYDDALVSILFFGLTGVIINILLISIIYKQLKSQRR